MTIIELLNKIANGEEVPRKFTYKGYLWEYDVKNKMWFYYFGEGKNHRFDRLFYLNMILNDTVEILEEENKIEKIDKLDLDYKSNIYSDEYKFRKEIMFYCDNLQSKINNLIDEINKLKEDK